MGRAGQIRRVKVKRREKASIGTAHFKKKVSALHTDMFIRIMKDREVEPAKLGELLEDMGNQFLDLADAIRGRVLAASRPAERAGTCKAAGGKPR
jgi:hypothetical protein